MRRVVRLPLQQLEPYLLQAPATPISPLSWNQLFDNEFPIEMEIGFGKGLFLLTAAQERPQVNFVGVEIERKYVLFTATRLAKRGLGNVRLVSGDARAFLRDHVAAGSLQAIHVYFPDPWWKTRHRKRRVFTEEFACQCERVLRPGGHLCLVTDVEKYFGVIKELIAEQTTLTLLPAPEVKEPEHDLDYLTNFERKYRREGRPIYRAVYRR